MKGLTVEDFPLLKELRQFVYQTQCPKCQGTKVQHGDEECTQCHGTGQVPMEK